MWVYGCVCCIVSAVFKIVCENIETKQNAKGKLPTLDSQNKKPLMAKQSFLKSVLDRKAHLPKAQQWPPSL